MKRKVFIGTQNISSQIADWKFGFNANNVETLTAVTSIASIIVSNDVDYNISKMKQYWFSGVRPRILQRKLQEYYKPGNRLWRKALRECDIFMFIWTSFNNDFSDYKILKEKGKKIITLFVGDDIRWYHAMKQHFNSENIPPIEYAHYDYSLNNLNSKLIFLRTAEKYSDVIVSVPDQSQLALRPYKFFSTIINLENIKENTEQREIPLIIHAPSDRAVKGTKYILSAIDELKTSGVKFEFKLLEKIPHHEILEWYKKADIVIGQLGIGLGKQGMEVLGSGCILLTGLHRVCAVNDTYFKENPAVNINKDNIKSVLESLIPDFDRRVKLAKKGRPFIQKYHNPSIMAKEILELLQIPEEDRILSNVPTFFRDKFIPESQESLATYNKWTDFVKKCSWYKKSIVSGERSGLMF